MGLTGKNILVALDFPNLTLASTVIGPLRGRAGFKVGLQLNTAVGTPLVIQEVGKDVFLDLKFHDIPNTVAGAVLAACEHGVHMLNVHCLGGEEMMRAAALTAHQWSLRPLVIGVTILTSQDLVSLGKVGIDPNLSMPEIVQRLVVLAIESGLDGVVCSPQEVKVVRQVSKGEKNFRIVTPGIRHKNSKPDDQKHTLTASEAVDLGATDLVIGRPITGAPDPVAAFEQFVQEIS